MDERVKNGGDGTCLSLDVVNGAALCVAVFSPVVVIHVLDRAINFIFDLAKVKGVSAKHAHRLDEVMWASKIIHAPLSGRTAGLQLLCVSQTLACILIPYLCSVNIPENHHCYFRHEHQQENDDKLWIEFQH